MLIIIQTFSKWVPDTLYIDNVHANPKEILIKNTKY